MHTQCSNVLHTLSHLSDSPKELREAGSRGEVGGRGSHGKVVSSTGDAHGHVGSYHVDQRPEPLLVLQVWTM